MAIQKQKVVTVVCDGICGQNFTSNSVPMDWKYLKVVPATPVPGVKPEYKVAALCPRCTKRVERLLAGAGFNLIPVNEPEQRSGT